MLLGDWREAEWLDTSRWRETVVYVKQTGKRAGIFCPKAADDLPQADFCSLGGSLLKTINDPSGQEPWEVQ